MAAFYLKSTMEMNFIIRGFRKEIKSLREIVLQMIENESEK